jgi:hypothetical protein
MTVRVSEEVGLEADAETTKDVVLSRDQDVGLHYHPLIRRCVI